jgi:phosphatidylserine/phosphatidylglycerophosphate/cardiolipin synthase-like enzyme
LEMSGTSIEREFSKYHAVIHLQTPSEKFGYNHFNPLRIETVMAAQEIDQKIGLVWHNHPRYHVIANDIDFLHKAETAIDLIKLYLPAARFK